MKIIFLGTPEFAIPSLEALIKTPWISILTVCTQTDKPAHRGKHLTEPPVKKLAQEQGIEVIQTKRISKEKEMIEKLKSLKPELFVSCSYGQILSQEFLDIAPVINVHASLLPKYKGAAPINWAILNGEKETGISIMKTELTVDSGPIILQAKYNISDNETSIELYKNLSFLGAETLLKGLELIRDDKAVYTPQDHSKATYAPMLKKEMGLITWDKSSFEIHNQIRGLQPWPSAYTHYNGKTIKIWGRRDITCNVSTNNEQNIVPGTIVEITDHITVKTKDSVIDILKVQLENKKIINAKDFVNGARLQVKDKFE